LKKHYAILIAVVLVVLSSSLSVPTQAETITKNFTLKHFDVTLAFPKTANPGDSILISITAEARSSIRVRDLSIQILAYIEGGDLQSIGSASLASDQYVSKGNKLHKELSVTVSSNIPRGALVTVVSETVRSTTYTYYSYYPYYYYYYYYYYPNYTGPYWYYPYYYGYYYPESYSQEYVESKALPGTYILTPTPEYVQLKSDYDKLSSDYEKLSSQYGELSAKYQEATEQNRLLSDQLSARTYELNNTRILAIIFIIATVILLAYLLYTKRRTTAVPATAIPVSGASAVGAPVATEPQKVKAAPEKKEIRKKEVPEKTEES
jgi:hypothetical protein